ncbi:MAG TPA: helix-turn-helix transcriptional regulator [Bacteroidales bacterium]|nr:helix-turn-helix transcriptional regulator [Bacteroidales bacterium]HPS16598.1 helix-turn-helix transcriptional regulator [Bacteroidales bacterium]
MKNDIVKKFGSRIRELRLKESWSQEELADKTGFHRTYIGMIERGERNLSLRNIEAFAKTFNISVSKLLNFT